MSPATHQTIKLGRGKHHAPDEGACVMELASMLAGEDFSDHPISVCPVIGSLLRAHNDSIDEQRRQDLYAYAAKVVGSRSSSAVQDARAARLIAWSRAVKRRQAAQSRLPRGLRSVGRLVKLMFFETHSHAFYRLTEHNDVTHAEVLRLLDELLAITPEHAREPGDLDALDVGEPIPVPSPR
jgi:hypothetical protein